MMFSWISNICSGNSKLIIHYSNRHIFEPNGRSIPQQIVKLRELSLL